MPNTSETQELQARFRSMERRISLLEQSVFAKMPPKHTPRADMVGLYIDALFRSDELSDTTAKLWASYVSGFDEVGILALALAVNDPFPWRPFLFVLDGHTAEGYGIFTKRATQHLLTLAENLLEIQGLEVLRPCDVINTPTATEQMLSTYQLSS